MRRVSERAARALGLRTFPVVRNGKPVVLEGGSIDVNGRGSLPTREECLLDRIQARNPETTRVDLEQVLRESLGGANVLWLGRGIAGDDTHGHVDDLCRFVNPPARSCWRARKIRPTSTTARSRRTGSGSQGSASKTAPGPRPSPCRCPLPWFFAGQRLPASYANFYVANSAALVPTFNDPADREALSILAELFPERAGDRDPRRGSRMGPRNAPLPHAAAAGLLSRGRLRSTAGAGTRRGGAASPALCAGRVFHLTIGRRNA